jgi:hypothetical protein
MDNVQSVLFNKANWNITKSRKWLKDHGFVYNSKVHTTPNFHRFRQYNPPKGARYIIKKISNGSIELVIQI